LSHTSTYDVFALAVKGKKTCVHQETPNSSFAIFTFPMLWDAVFQRDVIFNSNPNKHLMWSFPWHYFATKVVKRESKQKWQL